MDNPTASDIIAEAVIRGMQNLVALIITAGILAAFLSSVILHQIPVTAIFGIHLATFITSTFLAPIYRPFNAALLAYSFVFVICLKMIGAFFTSLGQEKVRRRILPWTVLVGFALSILLTLLTVDLNSENDKVHRKAFDRLVQQNKRAYLF